jgi:hypothetical protein
MGRCDVSGCTKPSRNGHGWCSMHYFRWRKHGDPTLGGRAPRIPAGPLIEALDARCRPMGELLDDTACTAVMRARKVGTFDLYVADRIAIRGLGLTVDEVYGFTIDEETADVVA